MLLIEVAEGRRVLIIKQPLQSRNLLRDFSLLSSGSVQSGALLRESLNSPERLCDLADY
jgi:hypothetical protein